VALREWMTTKYGKQFVLVATEKLLTYALGRGVEAGDMPLVRAITRESLKNNGRFSSIVLGIVRSQPFQVNMKVDAVPGATSARAGEPADPLATATAAARGTRPTEHGVN
jgi:hypothetical protein